MAALTAARRVAADRRRRARRGGMQASRRRRLNMFRYMAFTVFGLFFLLPLLAMVRFSLEGSSSAPGRCRPGRRSSSYPGPPALLAPSRSPWSWRVLTGVVMLVLLVPTMIWVRLRVRWFSRTLEFLCLLPLTIPAIVLVVGLAPIYNRIERYNVSALMLFWAYVVLALPYAYRALAAGLDAIDVTTLSEAARSLGASWVTVMFRVIVPNMWQAILNALLLTVGAGTRRVHHRLHPDLHQPAGRAVRNQPEYRERRGAVLGLGGRAAVRVRPAADPVLRRPPPPREAMR